MNHEDPALVASLKNFECRRCNQCCIQPGYVYIEGKEADEMAAFLDMSPSEFINTFCDLKDRRRLVLKKAGERCVLLDKNGCRVHPAKPGQCRDFPVKWRTELSLTYCEGMKEIMPSN